MAALSRVERLPDLGTLLARAGGREDDEQSPEAQMSVARVIAASFGAAAGEGG